MVVLPVCDGMTLFEYGTVVEALSFSWGDIDDLGYEVRTCGPSTGVRTLGGAALYPDDGLEAIEAADMVILTGVSDPHHDSNPEWTEPLQRAASRGARIASICAGAFALAEAGLLDGRRATTHWRHAALLQARYPNVLVTPSELVVRDGSIVTSAGSSAGLDLCLELIREDHGTAVANEVARRLVAVPHREGGQAQFVNTYPLPDTAPRAFGAMLDEISSDLVGNHSVASLALKARVSRRTLTRWFHEFTGVAPMTWVSRQRVLRAMSLLEHSAAGIATIAAEVGFGAVESFRYQFRVHVGLAPGEYRRRFRYPARLGGQREQRH
ncbi:helix-turn-helix domain-containing protein [Leucobacter aridicollis]